MSQSKRLTSIVFIIAVLTSLLVLLKFYNSSNTITVNNTQVSQLEMINIHQFHPYSKYLTNKNNDPYFFKKILCEADKLRLSNIVDFDFQKFSDDYIEDAFHNILMDPTDTVCKSKHKIGGGYMVDCKYTDGGKFICVDEWLKDVVNNECVVFSFGIAKDWTFEDMMDNVGCAVYAFDHRFDYPSKRGRNITFEKLTLAAITNKVKRHDTLSNILKKYNHQKTKISYLKIDIERRELAGIPIWLSSNAFKNVQQIAVEIHLNGTKSTVDFFKTLKRLYLEGDYRLVSYEPNGCSHNRNRKRQFYAQSEIVLKKVSKKYKANEKKYDLIK